MNLYVLLGKPVYRRWFLDGSDPDVRLVGLYVSSLFNVGGEVSAPPQTYPFAFLTAAGGITLIALTS